MEIRRNTSGTYSVFVPMQCERTGKYGFPVKYVGCVADGGYDVALNGVVDECHRRRYGMSVQAREQASQ